MSTGSYPVAPRGMAATIDYEVRHGWRVEAQASAIQVVIVKGHRVNHILHLILSIVTLGLWLPVWLVVSLTGGETRAVLTLQSDGTVVNSARPALAPGQKPTPWYKEPQSVAILLSAVAFSALLVWLFS